VVKRDKICGNKPPSLDWWFFYYILSTNMEKIKNLIIVAHPDDEVLWFGSILKNPNTGVIFCFQNKYPTDVKENFKYTTNVFKIIKLYKNILNLPVVWLQTIKTTQPRFFGKVKPETKEHLRNNLICSILMIDPIKIYTHNPWGEYGHSEHILVHNIVHDIAKKLKKKIIFPSIRITSIEKRINLKKSSIKLTKYIKVPADIYFRNKVFNWYKKLDIWTGEYFEKQINQNEEFLTYKCK
jgi:hypothetical protein